MTVLMPIFAIKMEHKSLYFKFLYGQIDAS